jgi:adenylate cyclase
LINGAADQAAIESITVGNIDIPTSESGSLYIYYRPYDASLNVSAADILTNPTSDDLRNKIDGHVVFIGTSAAGLLDLRTSTLGETIPGVSIHAQVTEQILSQTFLTRPEWAVGAEYIVVILLGVATALISSFASPIATLSVTGLAAIGILATTIAAFRSAGILLDATFPLFALAASTLLGVALRLLVTDRDSRKLRNAFAHYVAPTVLQEIERNPQNLKLGGEMRDVTVMFMDIENFTPLSEKLEPVGLVRLVNQILDAGSRAILSEKGTIDKYIGDAIMSFWNAPIAIADHQYHAAKAALAIRKAISQLNDDPEISRILQDAHLSKLAVRIGLASGQACVGNMGSSDRFDYSVLGETVNIAARVESACKDIGCDIAIAGPLTEKTAAMATLHAGHRALKGKTNKTPLYALIGDATIATQDSFISFRKTHDEMIEFIQQKKSMSVAKSLLVELADEHPTLAKYFERLASRINDFK